MAKAPSIPASTFVTPAAEGSGGPTPAPKAPSAREANATQPQIGEKFAPITDKSHKVIEFNRQPFDSFGAETAAEAPAGSTSGKPAGASVREAEADIAPDKGVNRTKVPFGKSDETDVEASGDAATDGAEVERTEDAEETSESTETVEATEATEATETEAETKTDDAAEEKAEEVKTEAPKETAAQLRRHALDALRLEAEKRELTQRLSDIQKAKSEREAAAEALVTRLQSASLDERLQAIGVKSKEELWDLIVTGQVPDFQAQQEAQQTQAKAPDPEVAALKQQLDQLMQERQSAQQATLAAQAQAATQKVRTVLSDPAVGTPFVLATPGADQAVLEAAMILWKADNRPNGPVDQYIIKAAKSAEALYREQYAPILSAAGVGTKPAANVAPAANGTAKPVAKKPVVPSGKRLAARGEIKDDLPIDDAARDAAIKREMGWA